MPRQNRVLPTGEIVADPARGTLTGNRGVLHDEHGQFGSARWRHRNWISCSLSYKDWRRPIMAPGHWTELFFLDEAVALAAGHRPCAVCRRAEYDVFRAAWAQAFGGAVKAGEIDRVLHDARIVSGSKAQKRHDADLSDLPDGTFILREGQPHLVLGDALYPYTPEGYGPPCPNDKAGHVTVMTPRPIVAVLEAGYRPLLHPSVTPISPSA